MLYCRYHSNLKYFCHNDLHFTLAWLLENNAIIVERRYDVCFPCIRLLRSHQKRKKKQCFYWCSSFQIVRLSIWRKNSHLPASSRRTLGSVCSHIVLNFVDHVHYWRRLHDNRHIYLASLGPSRNCPTIFVSSRH